MVDNLGVREDSKVLGVNRSSDEVTILVPIKLPEVFLNFPT